MNQIDLKGRQAVVTGGAQGIGRAVAERLIASGAGVTIWDVDAKLGPKTAEEIGAGFVALDLSDWNAVRDAAEKTAADRGRINILVNNAGIAGANATVVDCPVEEWQRVITIDLNAVF